MTKPDPSDTASSEPLSTEGRIFLPAGIATLFLFIALFQAHLKLLWADEFTTFWIGQQKSFRGIWQALAAGADPNPPLMHILSWWSTSLFGTSSVAIRLPSVLAMGLALVCLWIFLRRRFAPLYAAAGCLALMTTRAFDYAYDARSYSLLMGFAMAALLCWSCSIEARGVRRAFLLLGMTAALAAGLSSNYYGAVSFLPIAAGEICYSIATKRLRVAAWLAMLVAALPLLAYLKLVHMNLAEFGPHAWNKPDLSMVQDSYLVIVEGILWPVLALLAYTLWRSRAHRTNSRFPAWERAAIAMLIAYPIFAFLVALNSAAMISPRCAVPVCLGIVIAGVTLLARIDSRRAAISAVAFLCIWVLAREGACGYILRQQRHAFMRLENAVERTAAPGEPVVVGDSLVLMPLYWYGSTELHQQIVFPIDFDAIHRIEHDDSGEQNLWAGRNGIFPVPIAKPAELLQHPEERLLLSPPKGWLAVSLKASGSHVYEVSTTVPWDDLGGIFTPLAHEDMRIYLAVPK